MIESLGFLAAFGAALAWGSYVVPFKISRSDNLILFQALMGLGIVFSAFIASLLLGYTFNLNIYGIASGVLWAVANVISLRAVLYLGLSRAMPVIASLVILSSFLWGSIVFQELPEGLVLGFAGITTIILGVVLVSSAGDSQSKNIKKGILTAIVAGLIFGSQLVPIKFSHLDTKDFFFSVCLGIFLTSLLIAFIQRVRLKKELTGVGLLSGMIWNIGNLLSLIAISSIGLSKAIPVSQSAALVAVLWGIFYFKEITKTTHKMQIILGAAILIIGITVLGLA